MALPPFPVGFHHEAEQQRAAGLDQSHEGPMTAVMSHHGPGQKPAPATADGVGRRSPRRGGRMWPAQAADRQRVWKAHSNV